MKFYIISLLTFCLSLNSFAAQSLSTKLNNSYSSLRALGMGNAFTAVADDYSLLFYNPAGFARKPYNEVQFTLVGAGVSAKTMTIADDIKKAGDTPGTDNDKAQAISDVLDKYYGETLGGKLQAVEIFWVRKGWGFGIIPIDLTIEMTVNRQLGPSLDLNIRGDSEAVLGYGTSINKEFDAGITGKFLHRIAVEQSVSALELATNSDVLSEDRFKEGNNIDFDLGMMWTPDWFSKKESAPTTSAEASTSTAPEAVAPKPDEVKKEEVKSEDIKPADATKTTDASKTEETKKDETKPDEIKKDAATPEVKPEEKREPNAEDAAQVVQVPPVEGENKDAVKTEDPTAPKTVEAEKKEGDVKAADTKAAETKTDGNPAETKTDAAATATGETKPADKPADTPAGVVKLGEEAPAEKKQEAQLNAGPNYPLTLGMTVHNVMASGFTLTKQVNKMATETPSKLERTISVGSQYRIIDGEDFKLRAMLDVQDILHPNVFLTNSLHAGIEADYSPSGWFKTQFRAGLNQMYFTAGATLLFGVLNIDFVTYGEEVGTESNKKENRVTAAKLGFNF